MISAGHDTPLVPCSSTNRVHRSAGEYSSWSVPLGMSKSARSMPSMAVSNGFGRDEASTRVIRVAGIALAARSVGARNACPRARGSTHRRIHRNVPKFDHQKAKITNDCSRTRAMCRGRPLRPDGREPDGRRVSASALDAKRHDHRRNPDSDGRRIGKKTPSGGIVSSPRIDWSLVRSLV
jgi:hypothetical protein